MFSKVLAIAIIGVATATSAAAHASTWDTGNVRCASAPTVRYVHHRVPPRLVTVRRAALPYRAVRYRALPYRALPQRIVIYRVAVVPAYRRAPQPRWARGFRVE